MQRNPEIFYEEFIQMEEVLEKTVSKFRAISDEYFLKGLHSQWHIQGLIYHAKNLVRDYRIVSAELAKRLTKDQFVHVVIMHTPEVKTLMYEFYAFVNLARMCLDNLRYILFPLFKNSSGLPKSITDLGSQKTNCPVYERIANTQELQYLIDLRNCIVHYRGFSTSDNSLIVHEDVEDFKDIEGLNWIKPMAKGTYRITKDEDIVFNIFIPDKIFDWNKNKKLVSFTYNKRINILAESIRFLRHILFNYMDAYNLSVLSLEKRFHFDKNATIEKVDFFTIKF
ncbi:MAG: hypothetical protein JWM14_1914 [Chitinophagaceae bacterium]|nr:hypothetical protein [Chitinophagaceae bacterium]